jgi:methionyl-tRNA formyltransferase
MRLIFMGTPELSAVALKRLIDDGHEIAAVFTQPDKPVGRGRHLHMPPVKSLALERGIPVHQPAKIKTNEEVRQVFERIAPDCCVVAAYGKILPEWLLLIPRLGCVNVHASLLPKYRGAAPINWAIANGETVTGVTIMQMDPGMDTGPMLSKRALEIAPDESAPALSVRLSQLGAALLSETLPLIERGAVTPEPQDDSEATYAPMLKRTDGLIDWSRDATELANRVRAFQPWPGCFTSVRGRRLLIWQARAQSRPPSLIDDAAPATVLSTEEGLIVVACGGGTALNIEELQLEGKRRISARDFVNGEHITGGEQLGS